MKSKTWHAEIISWREHHIAERHFILILSFLIGVFGALAAFTLKYTIHLIKDLLTSHFSIDKVNYWYLVFPFIGITLSYLFVKYIVKDNISHGITRILYAISQRKSIIKLHNIWTSIVGSAITIGFGGSVGAEAPIVLTGAAIGSNLGKFFKMNQKTLMLLIGCGAAGAIGGIFKAPIAGMVFTLEVLMLDMTMTSILPILISSITATTVSYILSGDSLMFNFSKFAPFDIKHIPYIILLGVISGFVSLYFTRGMNALENKIKIINSPITKLLLGGVVLGSLIFLFPPLYGEGYDTIEALLSGDAHVVLDRSFFLNLGNNSWILILYLALILIFKIFASVATNAPGGVGGIFAPTLFMGSITGFIVSAIIKQLGVNVPTENFVLAGMAGLMSGVMHAPLTGIFLIAELTGGYNLFMTLMIVSVISYLTIIIFEPHSLYAMRLAQKGELITHHKDRAVLTLLKMENVIETDLTELTPAMTLGSLVRVISRSNRNVFPVVDAETERLLGIVLLDEVRNIMFRPELYDRFTVQKLMVSPPAVINVNMPMEKVMQVFEDSGAWNLPVVDDKKKYLGFVSKSKIFNSYRHVLVHFSDE